MLEMTDTFLHQGIHCENDDRQAKLTLSLLWFFATLTAILMILAVRAA